MSKGSGQTAHQWKRFQWIRTRSCTAIKQKNTQNDLTNEEKHYFGNLLTAIHSGDTLLITFINTKTLPKCRKGGKSSTFHTTCLT